MRRGLAELYASLLLVAIALSLGALAYDLAGQKLASASSGLAQFLSKRAQGQGALLAKVYQARNSTSLMLLLYNYGWAPARLTLALVNGSPLPLNITIPPSSLYLLTLPYPQLSGLVLVAEDGSQFAFATP